MGVIEQSIDLDVPARFAYRQWVRFEEFPRFMDGVTKVERLADGRLYWQASICGNDVAWYAHVCEEVPGQRISWRSEDGVMNSGVVSISPLDERRTRINLRVEYDPASVLGAIGYKLITSPEQVQRDLECFKEVVEDTAEEVAA